MADRPLVRSEDGLLSLWRPGAPDPDMPYCSKVRALPPPRPRSSQLSAPVEHPHDIPVVGPAREPPPPERLLSEDPLWQHIDKLSERCAATTEILAHLYWPRREHFFEESRRRHEQGGPWRLKATPGHGVMAPPRPTVNLFIADTSWLEAYKSAAANRGLRHGLLVHRETMSALARSPGYELGEVRVGHPAGFGVDDPADFWRYDLGNHRYKALHDLRFSKVVRFATPEGEADRTIDIPHGEVIAWW